MDIYGSFLGEEDAPPKQHVLRETREEGHSDSSLSMCAAMEGSRAAPPTVEESFDAAAFAASPQEEERAAATLAHSPDERQTPSSRKPNFAVLNNYRWGTYGAGDALLSESCVSPLLEGAADQEVECMLDGEDDIVLLADVPDLYLPVLERPEGWELGLGIYRFANETTKKAGDIMYYAANSVSDTGTKLLIEAKAKLSSSSDMAIVSVAGGAAAETFMFAIDRSRLLGHQLVNSLQGDPEMSRLVCAFAKFEFLTQLSNRRLHLRRLLASGSWADFSAKCQLATLPW